MLKKFKTLGKSTLNIFSLILSIILIFSFVSFSAQSSSQAFAADDSSYSVSRISLSNSNFKEAPDPGKISAATNWTAQILDEGSKGSTIDGVINLNAYHNPGSDEDEIKLSQYPENGTVPHKAPNSDEDDNGALMINSNGSDISYGYKSYTFTLAANSYYSVSVWVLTGDFTSGGACIRLAGMKNDLTFSDINTHTYLRQHKHYTADDFSTINTNADYNYGWVKYSFYIETSSVIESSAYLVLSLGDYYKYTDSKGKEHALKSSANGYALFDNVEILQYSPNDFYKEAASAVSEPTKTVNSFINPDKESRKYNLNKEQDLLYYSENNAEILSVDENGNILSEDDPNFAANDVGSFDNNENGWTAVTNLKSGTLRPGIFNEYDESIGIKEQNGVIPFSPNGNDDKIALISSYDAVNDEFKTTSIGYKTRDFKIQRFKYYRLSIWVKTINGSVASAAISGMNYKGPNRSVSPENPEYGNGQLYVSTEAISGNDTNASRNGWSETAFYLKGSAFYDYSVHLEIWLGGKDDKYHAGIAMFDNISIETISPTEYRDYSGKGKVVEFDAETEEQSISNGDFDEIEDYDSYEFPFTPKQWTFRCAGEEEIDGMSSRIVDSLYDDNVIRGVVSSNTEGVYRDVKSVDETVKAYFPIDTYKSTDQDVSNILMIKTLKELAVGYKSNMLSIGSNAYIRIDITMCADTESGYGACLVLRNGNKILSTIEQIDTNGKYETFSFYVRTGAKSITEPYLEIWNGLFDKQNNETKLSKGTIFVEKVTSTNFAESSGDNDNTDASSAPESIWAGAYLTYARNPLNGKIAIYDSKEEKFVSFDQYDSSFIKKSYTNTLVDGSNVTYGIFDGTAVENSDNLTNPEALSSVFWNGNYNHNGADGKYALIIKNNAPTYSRVENSSSITLENGKYYLVQITAKVNIPENTGSSNYKGAYMGLVGGDETEEILLTDVKTSASIININGDIDPNDTGYKKYNIYIKAHGKIAEDEDSKKTQSYKMVFGIGGNKIDEYAAGTLIISGFSCMETTNAEFERVQESVNKSGASKTATNIVFDLSDDSEEEGELDDLDVKDEFNMSTSWYAYSSILLVVAIIIGVIAFLVRYFARKRKLSGGEVAAVSSYDRSRTLIKQHNERNKSTGDDIKARYIKDSYDLFDEDIEAEIEAAKVAAREEQKQSEEYKEFITEDPIITADTSIQEEEMTETENESPEITESASDEPSAENMAEDSSETPEKTEISEEKSESEDNIEAAEVNYDEVVDFSKAAKEKKDRKAELEAKKAEEKAKKEAELRAKEEAESDRIKQIKKERKEFDSWDDFDD